VADQTTVGNTTGQPNDYIVSSDDAGASGQVQRVKLAQSADGSAAHVTADADGLLVNLGVNNDVTITGSVTVADGGGSITVDNATLSVVGGGVEATALRVTIANDSTGVLSVDDNGASLTVDNATISVVGGGTEATAQRVTIANDSTGVLSVDDNGGSLTVDGTVAISGTVTVDSELAAAAALTDNFANPTTAPVGAFAMVWDGATWDRLPGNSVDGALVNLGANNDVVVSGSVSITGGVAVTQGTASNLNAEVQGDAAHDAPVTGNPVLMGGRAQATAPTDVSLDGDAVNAWVLRNGAQATALTAAGALIGGDAANGLDVDVTRLPALVAGSANIGDVDVLTVPAPLSTTGGGTEATALRVTVANDSTGLVSVDDNGGSLTVDAPVGTPANVQVGDGTRTATVRDTGTSDSLNVAIVDAAGAQITSFGGGTQYTEDAVAATDPVGTQPVMTRRDAPTALVSANLDVVSQQATNFGAAYVQVVSSGGALIDSFGGSGGTAQADESAFTEGTTNMTPIGGVLNDTITSDPTEDQAAAVRITAKRGLHANLRKVDGTEIGSGAGTEANALRVTLATDSTGLVSVDDNGGSLTVDGSVSITGTVDTELPAAAALADGVANPTVPGVGASLIGFDGVTWDRLRTTEAFAGTGDTVPIVGALAAGIGPGFDVRDNPANLGTAVNSASVFDTNGANLVTVGINTTTTGTFTFEGTADNTNWILVATWEITAAAQSNAIVTSAQTPTAGGVFQMNAAGFRQVRLRTVSTLGATMAHFFTASLALPVQHEVHGAIQIDQPLTAFPIYVGGRASTAIPPAVSADGDGQWIWMNRSGAIIPAMAPHVGMNSDPWNLVHEAAQYTSTQTSTVLVTGGAGDKIVVTKVQIQAGGTVAGTLQLYFGTGAFARGTNRAIFDGEFAPSATLKPGVVMDGPFIAGTNGDDVMVTTSTAINPLTINLWYYVVT